ncbi:chloramphenicol acetyltransferase [Undibacterium sp. Jales W-56]|uniref:chloramphenicol acetyltransferase n=1 Tax=Undibacterium sp. Jales W-56 TaxID=2897325 RepID=UPI0021CF32A3|nr:chloramphenicol acetyltransferase [Undibacterium sp. Jales W-56]MCU6433578.1 chloramphenicol acetyltransferase [Undibacterium sp. Jales W-56]
MKTILDLATWKRREHFAYFSQFEEPFHGIVANVDCTWAYQYCKQQQHSFFLFYLYQVLNAVNQTDAMRYRIEDGQVVDYARINASATVQRDDHTFAFCDFPFDPSFHGFVSGAQAAMDRVRQSSGLGFNAGQIDNDVIHFSAMPWISFTGLTHARQFKEKDSVPKISVGKYVQQDGKLMMPVAVFVNHALVDGYHVHLFLQKLEALMNQAPGNTTES